MSEKKTPDSVRPLEALPASGGSGLVEAASGAPGPAYYAALEAVAADRRKSHAADVRLARQLAGWASDIHLQRLTAAIANRDVERVQREIAALEAWAPRVGLAGDLARFKARQAGTSAAGGNW